MKKIVNVLVLTLAMNFLLGLIGTAWVAKAAHLDREKFGEVKRLLFGPATTQATQPTTAPVAPVSSSERLRALLDRAGGRPAGEQVDFIRQTFDVQAAELDRRERELRDRQQLLELAKVQVGQNREKLEQERATLAEREQRQERLASTKGFQDSLALYSTMPAKQVKTIFMTLADDTVQQYLQAMPPRVATKVIKEFKAPAEVARVQQVLEKIRQSQAPPATAPATADASAPPGPELPTPP